MIPRIIHYVWVGGNPLPPLEEKCMVSWKRFCPNYEIKRWDETNFDISSNRFCKEAYEAKKFAFVSDYIRLFVLVNYGGIYMDTDVELVKTIDDFLVHQAFSGFEKEKSISTGIMGCEKGYHLFNDLLSDYKDRCFILPNGEQNLTTNVSYITEICLGRGLVLNNSLQTVDGFTLYPKDVFCPKNFASGQYNITNSTIAIHHFSGSWISASQKKYERIKEKIFELFGHKFGQLFIFPFFLLWQLKDYGLKKVLMKPLRKMQSKKQ